MCNVPSEKFASFELLSFSSPCYSIEWRICFSLHRFAFFFLHRFVFFFSFLWRLKTNICGFSCKNLFVTDELWIFCRKFVTANFINENKLHEQLEKRCENIEMSILEWIDHFSIDIENCYSAKFQRKFKVHRQKMPKMIENRHITTIKIVTKVSFYARERESERDKGRGKNFDLTQRHFTSCCQLKCYQNAYRKIDINPKNEKKQTP